MHHLVRPLAFCTSLVALTAAVRSAHAKPAIGSGEVLAPISAQANVCAGQPGCNGGFPEGILALGNHIYVSGPATFGTAGKGPSVVTVLARANGHLIDEIQIVGEQTAFEHALSGIAGDGSGDVFVVSTQLGVIRITRSGNSYTQTAYAPPLPDLPVCTPGGPTACSPTVVDLPPLSNAMAFDDARKSLLVANHAIFGDPAHFAVLSIFVDDRGD